jgi:predicted Zn-dependent peptidase
MLLLVPLALGAAEPRSTEVPFTQFTLSNGLRVILSQDRSAPVVAINVTYDVGSRNERPGRTGFAHLFEHMMFKGSENVGSGEHFYQVFTNGGNMNGTTNSDRTNYFETLPANQLELALFLEADRMRSLAITQDNLDNQRNAVQEERRQGMDNRPYGKASEAFQELLYDNFAYKHSTIGSMEDLNAATVEDVAQFFKTYYAPNNAVLSLVGDFDPRDARRLLEKYFGSIARQPAPPPVDMAEPVQQQERRAALSDSLARLTQVRIAYKFGTGNEPDTYALNVLTDVLSGGQSARLYRALVQRKQLVANISAGVDERRGPGALYISAFVLPGKQPADVEAAIYEEIEKVQSEAPQDWEMLKIKNANRAGYFASIRSAQTRATLLSTYKVYYDDPNLINTRLARFNAVTKDDVQRVAKTYLTPTRRTVMVVTPDRSPSAASAGAQERPPAAPTGPSPKAAEAK